MKSFIELLPCPFCGKVPTTWGQIYEKAVPQYGTSWPYEITCYDCHIPKVTRKSAKGAAKAWNRRVLHGN